MSDSVRRRDDRDVFRFLVSPYHPDALRYPVSIPATTPSERLRHAMTWNVFKTLEQVAPSLWMRLLVARSTGLPDNYNSAPHIAKVACWPNLKPAPSSILRRGRIQFLPVSVVIDTDDTVVTLLTPGPSELLDRILSDTAVDGLVSVAEATAWLAGTRSAYVSVVLPLESDNAEWNDRVRRRAARAHRVLLAEGRGPANLKGIGAVTWSSMHELLAEVESSPFIADSERRWVHLTAGWMRERLDYVRRDRRRLA
jgi:hypothetical protein